jgi:hypothetical protein
MADTTDNSKKLINASSLDRFAQKLDERIQEDIGALVNVIDKLSEFTESLDDKLGERTLKYVTQEEYDALTDAEKANETMMWIIIGDDNLIVGGSNSGNTEGLDNKQNKIDGDLITEDKTIVGAINEVREMIPCYDTRVGETKTYTFDGNFENKENIDNGKLAKISDDVYTLEQLEQATNVSIELSTDDGRTESHTFDSLDGLVHEMPISDGQTVLIVLEGYIYITNTEVTLGGTVIPPGMWASSIEYGHISKLEFYIGSSGELKEIDFKFIKTAMNTKPGLNVEGEKNEVFMPDEDEPTETQSMPGAEIFNSYSGAYKNVAVGDYSHAEGWGTLALGIASHAEGGLSSAIGMGTHAEGYSTLASGNYSHAEGNNTIASGENQHVEGKFNIEDTENKYAHIVGNGDDNGPSNAHTLD